MVCWYESPISAAALHPVGLELIRTCAVGAAEARDTAAASGSYSSNLCTCL